MALKLKSVLCLAEWSSVEFLCRKVIETDKNLLALWTGCMTLRHKMSHYYITSKRNILYIILVKPCFHSTWRISTCAKASCRILATGSLHPISTRVAMVCAVPKVAKPGSATALTGANLSKASCRKAACWLRPVLGGASANNLARIRAQQCRTCLLLGATSLKIPRRLRVKRSSGRQWLDSTARSASSSAASTEPIGALLPPPSTPSSRAWAIRIKAVSIWLGKDSAMAWNETAFIAEEFGSVKESETATKSLGKALRTANLLPFLVHEAKVRSSVRAPSDSPRAGQWNSKMPGGTRQVQNSELINYNSHIMYCIHLYTLW